MQHLDIILALLAALVLLYWVADRLKISYPILLVVAGLVIGLIPGLPVISLSPDVVFLIFLPPLLFDAARNTSWHDFRNNRGAIGRLAIGLVLFTTAGTAIVAHYFIPGFSWPLAFALGAIVSPPDAVAATSAIKGLGLPKKIVTILEGESLVNDASALIAYRYAVAAVMSGTFVLWDASVQFIMVAVGGIMIGALLAQLFAFLVRKRVLANPTVETCVTLLIPFVSYILAEHLGASGVLSVVATGLYVSWRSHDLFTFRTRLQMKSFWETLVFLLNGFVFILIGLQLPAILADIDDYSLPELVGYGLLVSAVVIAIRIVWIFPTVAIAARIDRLLGRKPEILSRRRELLVVGWAGMRGVVSLASALALPLTLPDGSPFPERSSILFITFIVILVTLVVQGLSLPFLIRKLKVSESRKNIDAEDRYLRLEMANYAIDFAKSPFASEFQPRVINPLLERYQRQAAYLKRAIGNGGDGASGADEDLEYYHQTLKSEQALIEHQRKQLSRLHRRGSYSDEVLRHYERELDLRSLDISEKLHSLANRAINPRK